jgi:hypothetical protein
MLALIALLLSYPVFRILKSVSQRGDGDAANNS